MEKHPDQGSTGYVFVLASVAALGGLLFGYDTAVISGAIGYLSDYFGLDAPMRGWAASSALIGCIAGACFAGVLSDWLGRKKVLILSAVLFTVSAVLSGVPQNLTQFAIARIIGGFGVGAASMLSPLYIAEVAPASIRGRLVSLNQLTIVGGMLVVYFVNALIARYGMAADGGSQAWNSEAIHTFGPDAYGMLATGASQTPTPWPRRRARHPGSSVRRSARRPTPRASRRATSTT